jgi:hypothetical protein
MLAYEHKRTQEIVDRLTLIGNLVRNLILFGWVLLLGGLFTIPAAILSPDLWWLGSLVGGLSGLMLGLFSASIFSTLLEWMAQLLVAQGEILAALKSNGSPTRN